MTNLEKFFGIKVQFKQILDPIELSFALVGVFHQQDVR